MKTSTQMSTVVNGNGDVEELIYKTIKRHAGLSDFDCEYITDEIEAILKALKKNGYEICKVR